jgi:hypothetical protein
MTVEDLFWFLAKAVGQREYFGRLQAINVARVSTRRSLRFLYAPRHRMLVVNYYPYGLNIQRFGDSGAPTDIGLWVPIPSPGSGPELLQSGDEIFPLTEAPEKLFHSIKGLIE